MNILSAFTIFTRRKRQAAMRLHLEKTLDARFWREWDKSSADWRQQLRDALRAV